jgi:hypothetical protein
MYLCQQSLIIKSTDMAIAIKSIPVLTGDAAERFVAEAESNAKKPTPKLSPERKARLDMVLRYMKEFQL